VHTVRSEHVTRHRRQFVGGHGTFRWHAGNHDFRQHRFKHAEHTLDILVRHHCYHTHEPPREVLRQSARRRGRAMRVVRRVNHNRGRVSHHFQSSGRAHRHKGMLDDVAAQCRPIEEGLDRRDRQGRVFRLELPAQCEGDIFIHGRRSLHCDKLPAHRGFAGENSQGWASRDQPGANIPAALRRHIGNLLRLRGAHEHTARLHDAQLLPRNTA